ncbi:MAG TPA: hypothetical protein VGN32_12305, partial [Ktedonobacterales bacterium]|nr:hypothetical protein [Ktedonobacterales bacterium]
MDGQHTPTPGRRARPPAPADLGARVKRTLTALVGISSVSGQEDEVREYLRGRLTQLDLDCWIDNAGNLIASLPGTGAPLLLNAHMDRVPPGRGH